MPQRLSVANAVVNTTKTKTITRTYIHIPIHVWGYVRARLVGLRRAMESNAAETEPYIVAMVDSPAIVSSIRFRV